MVCYAPGTGTLAVIGFAIYVLWHKAIGHFLGMIGTVPDAALLLGAEVAAAIALIWTARLIRRRRAQAGACTTCRFRCQEALRARPHLLVNQVDRRVTPPPPARPAARTCYPAAPIPGLRRAAAARPAAAPGAGQNRRAFRRTPLLNWRRTPLLNWHGIALLGSRHALTRPAVAPPPGRCLATPATWATRVAPAAAGAPVPARERRPLPSRPVVHAPAPVGRGPADTAAEMVPVDGCLLTPDGVDPRPVPAAEP